MLIGCGVRPLSADRMPLIGPVPTIDGVFLATGHGTKGIHLAPVTAEIVAGLVLHGQIAERHRPFLPTRFLPAPQVRAAQAP